MRLHLPLSLRSALLAVLVAVTPAFADVTTSYNESTTTLTFSGTPTSSTTSIVATLTGDANYANASKVIYAVSDPGSDTVIFTTASVDKAVQVGDGTDGTGIRFNNGNQNTTLTFTGAITGSGIISMSGAGTNKKMLFTGDTTGFTGTISLNDSVTATLQFGDGGTFGGTTSENQGLIGASSVSLGGSDILAFNYAAGLSPLYFTSPVTGTGTILVSGISDMVFTGAMAANTLKVESAEGSTTHLYLTDHTPSTNDREIVFKSLTISDNNFDNSGSGTISVHLAGGGSLRVNSSGTGTTLFDNQNVNTLIIWKSSVVAVKGGSYANIYGVKANLTLTGTVNITTDLRGASSSGNVTTINIGDGTEATKVTTNNFYGHYEHATTDSTTSRSTININNNATLSASGEFQVARDGIGELNILQGGTVITTQMELGANWAGTAESGKQAIVNLNGGTLILGATGITQAKNNNPSASDGYSIGQLNFTSGILAGSADWSSSCPINVLGGFTVNTSKYDSNGTATTDGVTITLSGALKESGNLTVDGIGTLALNSDCSSYSGTITLKNGTFTCGATGLADSSVIIKSSENATITTNSLDVSKIKSVSLATGAMLTYKDGTSKTALDLTGKAVTLSLTTDNIRLDTTTSTLTSKIDATTLTLTASQTTLDLSNEAVVNLFKNTTSDTTAKLQITTGTLSFSDGMAYKSELVGSSSVLGAAGLAITGIDGGALLLSGTVADVYLVTSDDEKSYPEQITAYRSLDPYVSVAVDKSETLSVALAGKPADGEEGLQVKNLIGVAGSTLKVTNSDSTNGTALVVLDNSTLKNDATADLEGGAQKVGVDTKMEGSITSGDGVEFLKTGEGTLTVSGGMDIDTLKGEEGTLALTKSAASIDSLVLSSKDATKEFTVNVSNGASLSTALFDTKADADATGYTGDVSGNGGVVTVGSGASLTVNNESSLSRSTINGTGSLNVNAALTLSGDTKLEGSLALAVGDKGTFALEIDSATVKTLSGDGTVDLGGGTLNVTSANTTFSGDLDGSGTIDLKSGSQEIAGAGNDKYKLAVDGGTLTLASGSGSSSTKAVRALRAVSTNTTSYQGITLAKGSTLNIGNSTDPNTLLSLGADGLTVNSGATLGFVLNVSEVSELKALTPLVTSTGNIALNSGSTLNLDDLDIIATSDEQTLKLTLMTSTGGTATLGDVSLNATFLLSAFQDLALKQEGTSIVLTGVARKDNVFNPSSTTPNSTAGAGLLWDTRFDLGSEASTLKDAYRGLIQLQNAGDTAGTSKALAAIAGSTVNALGTAQRDSLRHQLQWVRNRTVTMGVDPDYSHDEMPYIHMWIEGTGNSAQLNTDGDEGGYKLSSWGGSVGVDVDLTEHFTFGAALAAQFGTLSSSAAEYASGDLDSYYVSLFGRFQKRAWAHTVILTGSKSDASLDRTVNYQVGSYSTQGTTDGSGYGAMYELTYDIPMNEDKSSIFQPLFNASIVKTSMKGYTETGAGNAGLQVGKQDWTTATLALGARWMGLVGTNVFGREALLEVRANIAQDMGDDQGETKVGLIANPNSTQTVYGAQVGKTAGQLGVAIYLPVGQQGTVFVNGNAEVRSGAHAINGSLGYRYSF